MNIANVLASFFECNYLDKVKNKEIGCFRLQAIFVDHFTILQNMEVIQEFSHEGIEFCGRTVGSQMADSCAWYFEDATVEAGIKLAAI